MMRLVPFTPAPGGFVTAVQLSGGQFLIEGWVLNLAPSDGGEPRHEPSYHFLTRDETEAAETVSEFTGWLDRPLGRGAV
ncbi:hypothetical protein [Streptomyces sp. NPDC056480]|uniref:hypothetical protein n=1 Tax=Streptomyces sp. NPDC056480 TaxID=3345833 RepID=UPI0036C95FD7